MRARRRERALSRKRISGKQNTHNRWREEEIQEPQNICWNQIFDAYVFIANVIQLILFFPLPLFLHGKVGTLNILCMCVCVRECEHVWVCMWGRVCMWAYFRFRKSAHVCTEKSKRVKRCRRREEVRFKCVLLRSTCERKGIPGSSIPKPGLVEFGECVRVCVA